MGTCLGCDPFQTLIPGHIYPTCRLHRFHALPPVTRGIEATSWRIEPVPVALTDLYG